jgi:hypothetical protein
MSDGRRRLVLEPNAPDNFRLRLYDSGTSIGWPPATGWHFPVTNTEVRLPEEFQAVVTVDPNLKRFVVKWHGDEDMINHHLAENAAATQQPSTTSPCRILTRRT